MMNNKDNPLARLAARQRELEAELAAARKANIRGRAKPDQRQWHVQPTQIHEDEGWFTTYLDVMTLLLVLLVVMLSFAGKGSVHSSDQAPSDAPPRIVLIPPGPGMPAASISPLIPAGIGLLPAGNGLLPEIGIHHEHRAPAPAPQRPGDTGLDEDVAADAAPQAGAPAQSAAPYEEVAAPPGDSLAPAPLPEPLTEPLTDTSARDMLAGLPLGELGDDIDVIVNEKSVSFRINSEILFSSGQADLSLAGLAVLKRLIPVFNGVEYRITVEGHTDSVPMLHNRRYPSNWELSGARAGSVVRYLEANGVASGRLRAIGNADTRPLADNATPEGRASNRRVELIMERQPG